MAYAMKLHPLGGGENQDVEIIIARRVKRPNNDLPRTGTMNLSYPYIERTNRDLKEVPSETVGTIGSYFKEHSQLNIKSVSKRSVIRRTVSKYTLVQHQLTVNYEQYERKDILIKASHKVKICDFYENPQLMFSLYHNELCYFSINSSSLYDNQISGKIKSMKFDKEVIKNEDVSLRQLLEISSIIILVDVATVKERFLRNRRMEKDKILTKNSKRHVQDVKKITKVKYPLNPSYYKTNSYILSFSTSCQIISSSSSTFHRSKIGIKIFCYYSQFLKSKRMISHRIFFKRSKNVVGHITKYKYKHNRESLCCAWISSPLERDNKSNSYTLKIKQSGNNISETIYNNTVEWKNIFVIIDNFISFDKLLHFSIKLNNRVFISIYIVLEIIILLKAIKFLIKNSKLSFTQEVIKTILKYCNLKYSAHCRLNIKRILHLKLTKYIFLSTYFLNLKNRIYFGKPNKLFKNQKIFSPIQYFYFYLIYLKTNDKKNLKANQWKEKKQIFFIVTENIKDEILVKNVIIRNDNTGNIFRNQQKIHELVITSDSYITKTSFPSTKKKESPTSKKNFYRTLKTHQGQKIGDPGGSTKNNDLSKKTSSDSNKSKKDKSKNKKASEEESTTSVGSKEKSSCFGKKSKNKKNDEQKNDKKKNDKKKNDEKKNDKKKNDKKKKDEKKNDKKKNDKKKKDEKKNVKQKNDKKKNDKKKTDKQKEKKKKPKDPDKTDMSVESSEKIITQIYHADKEEKSSPSMSIVSGVNLSPSPSETIELASQRFEQPTQQRYLPCGCKKKDYATEETVSKSGFCGRLFSCSSKDTSNKCLCGGLFKCFRRSPTESKKGLCCSLKCSKTTAPNKVTKDNRKWFGCGKCRSKKNLTKKESDPSKKTSMFRCGICGSKKNLTKKDNEPSKKSSLFRCGICRSKKNLTKKESEPSKKSLQSLFGCRLFGICPGVQQSRSEKYKETTYGKFRVVANIDEGEINVSIDKSSRKRLLTILNTLAEECEERKKKS